jgi:Ankyrin repeats (3 copies)
MGRILSNDTCRFATTRSVRQLVLTNFRFLTHAAPIIHHPSLRGANQALQDGPLMASWLERAAIEPAVKGFMREAVQRSAPIVQSSHQTARKLHHPKEEVAGGGVVVVEEQSFAGVRPECTSTLLSTLKERRIGAGAGLGDKLDDSVARAIGELNVGTSEPSTVGTTHRQHDAMALELSSVGNTQGLRGLSLQKHARSIQCARDGQGRSCLHLAAMGGHTATCKWLLAEVACDGEDVDEEGKTALYYAKTKGHQETVALFHAWKNIKH